MILSDRDLRAALASGQLRIEPLGENAIQPSSIDLRIGAEFRVFANNRHPYIDVRKPMDDLTDLVVVDDDAPFILHPGEFVLGTTFEKVTIPDDMVARLEGKSSLARLGLLIHSSLPGDELVLFRHEGETRLRPIEDIVRKQLTGEVVSYDPDTFETIHAEVTGWYEGPEDHIHEVVLASGRRVRVTRGHNLFTLDRDGAIAKVRTGQLEPGTLVAVPRVVPEPEDATAWIDLIALAPESAWHELVCEGPSVAAAFEHHREAAEAALRDLGIAHISYYRARAQLPLLAARQIPGLLDGLGGDDRVRMKGGKHAMPPRIEIGEELAWLLGLYVAEGYRRRTQVVVANTDQAILDHAEAVLTRLGAPVYRSAGAVTGCSTLLSALVAWLGMGGKSKGKRLPAVALGWPQPILAALLEGFVDGDGSREATRTSLWSSSPRLVDDLLLLCARLGRRAAANSRERATGTAYQVSIPRGEHKLLTAVPLPDELLVRLREAAGLDQRTAAQLAGYRYPSSLCNLENRTARDAVRRTTLARLRDTYSSRISGDDEGALQRLERLVEGDLAWDRVVEVRDTGRREQIFDLEVRPDGRPIENFLAGDGGVFVSNTAGFVDAGWSGHLTLELSNVANLPITLYPEMKIGQLAFFPLTSPAEHPYGSTQIGSKYQGQRGPTPSRYHENFDPPAGQEGDAEA
ncbi:MAG: dCTP deaminase [Nitriliruptor sp.]